jgi:uncharacterized protein with von Willebrand factor type A (vWA) domain
MQVNDNSSIMPSVVESLRKLCEEKGITDQDLVLDVYQVCNDKGTVQFISTDDLLAEVERTDPAYWTSRVSINQRKDYLENLANSHYMAALIALNDPMKATLVFVEHLVKAYASRASVAHDKHRSDVHGQSSFYSSQEYLDEVEQMAAQVSTAEDFDHMMDRLVTPQQVCSSPVLSAFFCGCGVGKLYDALESPGSVLAEAVVKEAVNLPDHYPMIYQEFTRISEDIGSTSTIKTDTDQQTDENRKDRMEDFGQLDTVDPTEIAQEGYDIKLAEKKLEVNIPQDEDIGVCHLFVLLDVSGSMDCTDIGPYARGLVANILTLSLLQFAMKDKWVVHVVPFAGDVARHKVQHATDEHTALAAMRWLGRQSYTGGSTDIQRAVLFAYQELQNDPTYRKCDIVLITDGCSPITYKVVGEKPERTKLRTLFVSSELPYGTHARHLVKASDTHKLVRWDVAKGCFDIGDALSHISDRSSNDPTKASGQSNTAPSVDPDNKEDEW